MNLTDTPAEARRHELLADVAEQAAVQLMKKHGVAEEQAIDVGNHLADWLAEHWKGQNIYIVGDQSFRLSKRDWEIFRRMERGNAHELAREFGISYVRVHQIYRRCLVEWRKRSQNDLFGAESGAATAPVIHSGEKPA
ncbi:Mor transcription activator family protein [Variovorax sp. VNK109]|uniref:Mor transcription activator family protein n=1 Tax=Variovorax sp. VNK109 TaxID=3400919 RepID=UPI003C0CBB4C